MGGNNEFFENFERNKYLKKLPSMQRVNMQTGWSRPLAVEILGGWSEIQPVVHSVSFPIKNKPFSKVFNRR